MYGCISVHACMLLYHYRGVLPLFIQPSNTVNSKYVVGVKPGDSGVMIGYQVDVFSSTWSPEHFVAQLHWVHGQGVSNKSLST